MFPCRLLWIKQASPKQETSEISESWVSEKPNVGFVSKLLAPKFESWSFTVMPMSECQISKSFRVVSAPLWKAITSWPSCWPWPLPFQLRVFGEAFYPSPAAAPSDLPGFADGHFGITCLPGGDDGQKGGEGWCNVVIQGNWKPVGWRCPASCGFPVQL